jgi:hypothetical protein
VKAFTSIFLAFLYLSVSSGFNLRTHYCMGRLASIGIGYESPKKCGKCGMHLSEGHKGGCCKDEHRLVKLDTDQQVTPSDLPCFLSLPIASQIHFTEPFSPLFFSEQNQYPVNHDPPRIHAVALYLRDCVFLI